MAPRFDAQGKKTENARFLRVRIDDVLLQENVELVVSENPADVPAPSRTSSLSRLGGELARLQHGATVRRAPLPSLTGDALQTVVIRKRPGDALGCQLTG